MRTRRSSPPPPQEEDPDNTPRLQFNQSLSWRAGKPIPVGELLKRLKTLVEELCSIDQEQDQEVDRESFRSVASQLTHSNITKHKDRGVRAWAACAQVEILRVCAPDAPFTSTQLKEVFSLIVNSILPALSDPTNAYNSQHLHVLTSLSDFKSICLLGDVPTADELMLRLFTCFFDVVSSSSNSPSGESLSKNAEYHMTSILVILIDESNAVPPDVIDVILAQFLRVDPKIMQNTPKNKKEGTQAEWDEKQTTLLLKELPPAYNMAKGICMACPEKMARYASQYFNDVAVDASETVNSGGARGGHRRASLDDDSDVEGPTYGEDDLKDLRKAHQLIRELWRACPEVLPNVIPQLDAELSADNVPIRLLATETLGDIAAGIGAAGLPPPPPMDPAAYPTASLATYGNDLQRNILTMPNAPLSFPQTHSDAYKTFLSRRMDKSSLVRSAWTTAIGRILSTSAGGRGLSPSDEQRLLDDLARMLGDGDEKVRIAGVKAVGRFGFRDIIMKLSSKGGVDTDACVLSVLAERVKDRKHHVREEAMRVLSRIWGVAVGEIQAGNEQVQVALGGAPTKIFESWYTGDPDVHILLDHCLFELLLPMGFPPIKSKQNGTENGSTQTQSQQNGNSESTEPDPDMIRTQRILTLLKGLDEKAKKVFCGIIGQRQVKMAQLMTLFIQKCDDYNGGTIDDEEEEKIVKKKLAAVIEHISKLYPEVTAASNHLWKFADRNDRRNYKLIQFCMAPESDYRTVYKAIKELEKRVKGDKALGGVLETMMPLIYRSSLVVYNKSHVPAIIHLSREDGNGLGSAAHELLQQISDYHPEILKSHVKEICKTIEEQRPDEPGALDTLKACAGFAKRLPKEMPKGRSFLQCLVNYATQGPPEVSKQAVTILMATADKKEMYARELMDKSIKGFEYGCDQFLTKIAMLSQLILSAPREADRQSSKLIEIARDIIQKNRSPSPNSDYEWSETIDDECAAKYWALRLLANRVRCCLDVDTDLAALKELGQPIYKLLIELVDKEGEISSENDTPATHKPRLRLQASQLLLKLSRKKPLDDLLTPSYFNSLSIMAQDSVFEVRSSFITKLKKYLIKNSLPPRFYTVNFLLAFEPITAFKRESITWIRSRAAFFKAANSTVMEMVFARLLTLLAHHPDYEQTAEELLDMARYITFYLQTIAREENLGLIFHIAQRVKQTRDSITPNSEAADARLHTLSDLAQATIRAYEDIHNWSMQTFPGKVHLPASLFRNIETSDEAHEIARKTFLPDGVEERLEGLIRQMLRPPKQHHHNSKKRKPTGSATHNNHHDEDDEDRPAKKRAKSTKSKSSPRKSAVMKTPKRPKKMTEVPSSEIRRSGRTKTKRDTYIERDSSEDDEELERWDRGETTEQEDEDEENEEEGENENENEGTDKDEDVDGDKGHGDNTNDEEELKEASEEAEAKEPSEAEVDVDVDMDKEEEEEDNEEEDDEKEEKEPTPKPTPRTRAKSKPKPKPKPKPKAKPKPKQKPNNVKKPTTRTTRSRRGKVREEVVEEEEEEEEEEEAVEEEPNNNNNIDTSSSSDEELSDPPPEIDDDDDEN